MSIASALVIDIGANASHGAIVARELGVPCVIGTGSGTTDLRTATPSASMARLERSRSSNGGRLGPLSRAVEQELGDLSGEPLLARPPRAGGEEEVVEQGRAEDHRGRGGRSRWRIDVGVVVEVGDAVDALEGLGELVYDVVAAAPPRWSRCAIAVSSTVRFCRARE